MGTGLSIPPAADVTLARAADDYLATLSGDEQASTRRQYGRILRRLVLEFGADAAPADLDPDRFAGWFASQWGQRSPSTWNVSLDAIRSAVAYWQRQGWLGDDFSRMLERRKPRPDHTRALTRAAVEQLLTREDIPLRERTFWSLLYETAARAEEVLALDIEDLDRPNRKAKVRRKGGVGTIDWQARTARLLPRLIGGRTTGPLFVTSRKARVELPAAHLDERGRGRLSYQQAEALFKEFSGGATLHQLRHSKLTHEAEDGVTLPVLMALSGRTSVRSLAKYARVSAEVQKRRQAERDLARRQQVGGAQ
jgi:integrase